jgi:hypothetical protein
MKNTARYLLFSQNILIRIKGSTEENKVDFYAALHSKYYNKASPVPGSGHQFWLIIKFVRTGRICGAKSFNKDMIKHHSVLGQ